jgi:hypothetical protein
VTCSGEIIKTHIVICSYDLWVISSSNYDRTSEYFVRSRGPHWSGRLWKSESRGWYCRPTCHVSTTLSLVRVSLYIHMEQVRSSDDAQTSNWEGPSSILCLSNEYLDQAVTSFSLIIPGKLRETFVQIAIISSFPVPSDFLCIIILFIQRSIAAVFDVVTCTAVAMQGQRDEANKQRQFLGNGSVNTFPLQRRYKKQ